MGFFDSFFGKSQQRDLSAARDRATGLVNTGYDRAEQASTQGYNDARGYIDPYIQSGRRASTSYENALGLNGRGGYDEAMGQFGMFAQPEQEATRNALSDVMRRYNAGRGGGGPSGGLNLAVARTAADRYAQTRNSWLDRINAQGQQGWQASQAGAGLASDYGNQMANYAIGRAGTLAGNEINYGNALAASRSTGLNNLFKIGEIGGKIAAAAATGGKGG